MPLVNLLRARIESSLGERLNSTLLLRERQPPLTVSTGVPALDILTGGLPRGALSEVVGPASSGRTGVMLAALAGATRRQEICTLVDASDSFDPASAERAGIDLTRLLWVRCNERAGGANRKEEVTGTALGRIGSPSRAGFAFARTVEQVLKVTDLLLQGGGFGMVALDLGDIPSDSMRRVPLTSWFRFRRAVEPTATVLLVVEQEPWAKTCASLVVKLQCKTVCARDSAPNPGRATAVGNWQVLHTSMARGEPFHDPGSWENSEAEENCRSQIPENNVVSHAALLRRMNFRAEVMRSWAQRKPPHSVGVRFDLRTAL
jgi:recombination protein RecA